MIKYLVLILLTACSSFNLGIKNNKKTILHFFAPYCYTCIPELNELKKSANWFNENGWEVVIVGTHDEEINIKNSLRQLNLPFRIIIDKDSSLAKRYSVSEIPYTIIFDKSGHFLKIRDISTGKTTSHLSGPRSWNSYEMLSELKKY